MSDIREVPRNLVRTKEVVGIGVKNTQNENLGKIEEVVLDKQTGHACYVVLSFGGILGMGDALFALPWNAIKYNEEQECFILNIDKDKLKNAPGFDKDNWPNMAEKVWGEKISNYYGVRPY